MKNLCSLGILFLLSLPVWAGDLTIKGSDTMQVMNQALAQGYMKNNSGVNLAVSGGGSGVGIAALLNNTTDIAAASRLVKAKEEQDFLLKNGAKPQLIPIALDGVAIFVNRTNPVDEITVSQLAKIFHGDFTNWRDLGGNDAPISVYSRETSSGTYTFIKDVVLAGTDYTPQAQTLPGTAAVYDSVSKDSNGIGYGGIGYNQGVKILRVRADDKSEGYLPSKENVESKLYPLSRTLNYYVNPHSMNPEATKFIAWVLGPVGQKIVVDNNYYALPGIASTTVASTIPNPPPTITQPGITLVLTPGGNSITPVQTPPTQMAPLTTPEAQFQALIQREELVLDREEKLALRESALADRESKLADREAKLNDRELKLVDSETRRSRQ